MSDSGRPNKRPDPDSAEFSRLLLRLGVDHESAWREYERLRRRLIKFFECNNWGDVETLADEVLDRVAKRPDVEQIRSVPEFAIGVARNVSKEDYRKQQRERHFEDGPGGADFAAGESDPANEIVERIDSEARMACLEAALARLGERDRSTVLEYYDSSGIKQHVRRKILAIRSGSTMNALRVHMARLRERLEREVSECLEHRRRLAARRDSGSRRCP